MARTRTIVFEHPFATFTREDGAPPAASAEQWPYQLPAVRLEEALSRPTTQPSALLADSQARLAQATSLRAARLAAIPGGEPQLLAGMSPFGPDMRWPYMIMRVLTSATQPSPDPLGQAPAQLGAAETRTTIRRHLCLFNMIVALEWEPTEAQFARLKWAFRRASDFLYDVTDGTMAIGQVIFGDSQLMDCADIQILASNRLLPRSWVDGLIMGEKYAPIRMGRGLWQKRQGKSIPWDEPEAYRTLVHEWSHYAIGLKDLYLNVDVGVRASERDPLRLRRTDPGDPADAPEARLTLPSISHAVTSIMSYLEGTSELTPKLWSNDPRANERAMINARYYPVQLADRKDRASGGIEPNEGPGQLPLPLPHFAAVGALENLVAYVEPPPFYEIRLYRIPAALDKEHCWVYLLDPAGARVIDQGSLDLTYVGNHSAVSGTAERRVEFGFPLLGARADDRVLLVGRARSGASLTARGTIRHRPVSGNQLNHIVEWDLDLPDDDDTPPLQLLDLPGIFVDVIPAPLVAGRFSKIAAVEIEPDQPGAVILTGVAGAAVTPIESLAALQPDAMDGHVLITHAGEPLPIATFSQGGAPGSGFPVSPNPIPAGSSDGNALLFFGAEEDRSSTEDQRALYASYRVITTRMHGDPGGLPAGARPASYAFSVASNQALLPELNPSLVLFYDTVPDLSTHDLRVFRYDRSAEGGPAWRPLPTLVALNDFYAAIPLTPESTPGLFGGVGGRFVERFRLFSIERTSGERAS